MHTHTSESATQMHIFGETVAKFLQGFGLMCTLLPHRGRSVSSPGSITHTHSHTHPVCDWFPLLGCHGSHPPHQAHRPTELSSFTCEVCSPEAAGPQAVKQLSPVELVRE